MNKIPVEIEEYIFDFIYYKKCYLKEKEPILIKKCACLNKTFYKKFKCKPLFIKINEDYLEFCLKHDRILLENLNRIFSKVNYNYHNPMTFYLNIIINDEDIEVPLTNFYLEPYIGVMDMDYIYHSVSFPEIEHKEVWEILRIIRKIFNILKIDFDTSSFGVNSFKLENHFDKLKNLLY